MGVEDVFVDLCKNGKLKEAHQLFLSNDIDIFRKYRHIFREFCCDEYLDIAKWLLSIDNRPFSSIIFPMDPRLVYQNTIRSELELMFVQSCQYGEIETAKWLYSLGVIDVHIYQDSSFALSCSCGQIESVKFLLFVGNKYNYLYEHTYDNNMAKFLFDHNLQARSTDDFVKLSDHLVEKYRELRESMMSAMTKHLIPDISELVYYYV
jgi:hypothetical protein